MKMRPWNGRIEGSRFPVHRPKKCTVCGKKLRSEMTKDNVKWSEREQRSAEYCQCKRCLHNIIDADEKPWVCDECKE